MAIEWRDPLWSPNYGGECSRSGICIHHAATTNFDAIGWVFQDAARETSAHYAVGDGIVQQFVHEYNQAWHTGNTWGNANLIGIECVNDSLDPYTVSEKTLETLAELMADIAVRNGMGYLSFGYNVFAHRDLSATYCPSDYVYERMTSICKKANDYIDGGMDMTPEEHDMLATIHYQITRTNGAGWKELNGHDMYGAEGKILQSLAALSEQVKALAADVKTIKAGK